VSTLSSASFLVDLSDTATYTALPDIIKNITIATSSTKVGDLSTYTFLYSLTRIIKNGSTILITFPP
jgi:hypothetical protein